MNNGAPRFCQGVFVVRAISDFYQGSDSVEEDMFTFSILGAQRLEYFHQVTFGQEIFLAGLD